MHFGREMVIRTSSLAAQTGGGGRRKRVPGPAPFLSLSDTCLAEAKARQPLSGPYQCCLRWRAFGARAPRASPWRKARPGMGSEPWNWMGHAAALGIACLRPSHPRFWQLALPPRALPLPVLSSTHNSAPLTSEIVRPEVGGVELAEKAGPKGLLSSREIGREAL